MIAGLPLILVEKTSSFFTIILFRTHLARREARKEMANSSLVEELGPNDNHKPSHAVP